MAVGQLKKETLSNPGVLLCIRNDSFHLIMLEHGHFPAPVGVAELLLRHTPLHTAWHMGLGYVWANLALPLMRCTCRC